MRALLSVRPEAITSVRQTGSAVDGCQLDEIAPGRLSFRLIRVRSPASAYYRVCFPAQVKDSGE
jgi:hypothetical protein